MLDEIRINRNPTLIRVSVFVHFVNFIRATDKDSHVKRADGTFVSYIRKR